MYKMFLNVQGNIFEIDDDILPKDGYLNLLLTTDIGVDMIDNAYVLDVDVEQFEEYYKFLQFRTDFILDEAFFDFMGHPNTLQYPPDFWKIKLIDDRIRDMWYIRPYNTLIELDMISDVENNTLHNSSINYKNRIDEILDCIPGGKLPIGHYIAGGAALYIMGITNKFNDIDIFTCNMEESIKYIENELGPDYYGVYQSGNAITFRSRVSIQIITREYSNPSQIVHGFDIGSCSIIFDGNRMWTTNKGLYCIENMVNWFEPDRSSPTYALRLAKYHTRGFKLMLPSTEGLCVDIDKIENMERGILYSYYNSHVTEVIPEKLNNVYLDRDDLLGSYDNKGRINYLRYILEQIPGSIDPDGLSYDLEDPANGDKTYLEIIYNNLGKNKINCTALLSLNNIHEYVDYINKYALIHTSPDPLANPSASALKVMTKEQRILQDIARDPMSIIILTSMFGYLPSLLVHKNKISDYEVGTSSNTQLTNVNNIVWYQGDPMIQSLTGTFYPEPILEDVRLFYLSSPYIKKGSDMAIQPRRWYKKRYRVRV